jgi:hypothetical protein
MSLEALDHDDFDTVIDWNTVTKHVAEDGSETVEIAPRELPEQSVIDAKKKLLHFCLDSLEQTKRKSITRPKENAPMKEETNCHWKRVLTLVPKVRLGKRHYTRLAQWRQKESLIVVGKGCRRQC